MHHEHRTTFRPARSVSRHPSKSWELGQTRVSNKVNEIASFSNAPGPTWFAPSYDAAGNMTIAPVPSLPGPLNFRSQEFDAWNRLTKAVTSTAVLGEYGYDGLNRRITKKTFSGGTPLNTRHYYYSQDWQVLEERLDSATTADRQFVWGIRYIDDLLLRDRDTNADGTLDERLYGLQDDNWNLSAVADTSGDIQERYRYDAYGQPTILTPAFAARTSSLFDWETLYASYRWDAETKMYQVRNRWLDSRVGVWVTRDALSPVGVPKDDVFFNQDSQSIRVMVGNPYAYGDAHSVNYTDPMGMQAVRVVPCNAKDHQRCKDDCGAIKCKSDPSRPRWNTGRCWYKVEFTMTFGNVSFLRGIINCTCDLKLAPPGDCTTRDYERLKNDVARECWKKGGADSIPWCDSGTAPADVLKFLAAWSNCAAARLSLMDTCFRGGDQRHLAAALFALRRAKECADILGERLKSK